MNLEREWGNTEFPSEMIVAFREHSGHNESSHTPGGPVVGPLHLLRKTFTVNVAVSEMCFWGWAFGTSLKTLHGTPAPHIGVSE